jgi:hypothetical protein
MRFLSYKIMSSSINITYNCKGTFIDTDFIYIEAYNKQIQILQTWTAFGFTAQRKESKQILGAITEDVK